jgi:hypothetical protein
MTTAVCVKTGTKYPSEYANILARSLIKHGYKGKLACITDNPADLDLSIINPVIMPNPDKSWWDKLYLYSWGHGINDSLIYYDLDMVIVGDVGCFQDWSSYIVGSRFDDDKFINSTLVHIPQNFGIHVWLTYNENREEIKKKYDWDSKYLDSMIGTSFRWQDLYPNALVSYKFHVRGKELHGDARAVSFHGKPNPNEVSDEFVKIHWV